MIRETFIFIVALHLFPISLLGKVFLWLFWTGSFSFGRQEKSGHWLR